MKNIFYKIFLLSILLVILFTTSNKVFAIRLPSFTVNIIVNSTSSDAIFNYNLELLTPVYSSQQFGIGTQNGQGNYSTSTIIYSFSSSTLYLTQVVASDWHITDISCTSTDSRLITEPYDNGVSITVYPSDLVNCTFSNTFDASPPVITILGDNPLSIY